MNVLKSQIDASMTDTELRVDWTALGALVRRAANELAEQALLNDRRERVEDCTDALSLGGPAR